MGEVAIQQYITSNTDFPTRCALLYNKYLKMWKLRSGKRLERLEETIIKSLICPTALEEAASEGLRRDEYWNWWKRNSFYIVAEISQAETDTVRKSEVFKMGQLTR